MWGRTHGIDACGRVREGRTPAHTQFLPQQEVKPRAPPYATYSITINFDLRFARIACYRTVDDAIAGSDAIHTHTIDLEGWAWAKVWVSTKTQETIFCIPRVDVP